MRISRASAKEYFIQRAKIALNFATTKFLIFFEESGEHKLNEFCESEARWVEREHELGEFCELSEFYFFVPFAN